MTRQRDITPTALRDKRGRFTGRYTFDIYAFNRQFTRGVICGGIITGISIIIAIYIGG